MNSCRAPQLNMSPKRFTMATTELFFASEQTRVVFSYATLNECRFMQCVLNIHGSGYSTVWLIHGYCRCCCLGASYVYTIQPCTSLQRHFIQSHIHRVRACLAVACHLHFWQNDQDLLHATVVTRE